MSRLVVVSNRCNVPRRGAAPGGLAVALNAVLRARGGVWFGWDGRVSDNPQRRPTLTTVDGVTYATVPLQESDYESYYKGYSNRVLWPLFHYRADAVQFDSEYREAYRQTNEYLARKLMSVIEPDDHIWVHDYHLIPLGRALREAGVRGRIGFFLHIPFPPYDVLRINPDCVDLLWAFRAYDVIGFQTDGDRGNFLNAVSRGTSAHVDADGNVDWGGDRSRAATFPISIDPEDARRMAVNASGNTVKRLGKTLHDRSLVIGVDRLDYSKGLPDRFLAFERLLSRYPDTVGTTVFLQIAQPSRGDVPEYEKLRIRLESIVGEINGRFAEFDWVPLRYVNKGYARSNIMGFLSMARVGLVTPLRDGMNLVAKEYVSAQDPADPGVLVLSEFTGAADELDTALLVNPFDCDAVADAIQTALKMPLRERRERWEAAQAVIVNNDIHAWSESFVAALEDGGA